MDNKNTYYLIGAIVVILAIIGGAYYYSQTTNKIVDTDVPVGDTTVQSDEIITARHQFVDGHHIVAGSVNLPTPCHLLTEDVKVAESAPEQVTLAFTATTTAETCIQSIIPVRFKLEFDASENAVIGATWNGSPVRLNLVPVGPGEDIDDYEVFIKG